MVYVSFSFAKEDTIGELLREVELSEDGDGGVLGVCLKMQGGQPAPHIVPLRGLGVISLFK